MKNVKDQVYAALLSVTKNVSDVYPKDWADFPTIQYVEEDNSVYERTDNKEQSARVAYKVDIWDNKSTSEAALAVDEAISALGLIRTSCRDQPDPSGLKHKIMRYEVIIDNETQMTFFE